MRVYRSTRIAVAIAGILAATAQFASAISLIHTFDDPSPTVNATISPGDNFGRRVAIDGNNILIGAHQDSGVAEVRGQAHLYDATTGSILQTFDDPTPTFGDLFGAAVAIDGNNVLIGAPNDDTTATNVGQAHLFDASTGNLLKTFNDPTPTTWDFFGQAVAIDGNNVLIGSHLDDTIGNNVGQAHLFDATTGNLLQTYDDPTPTAGINFGVSVAIDGDNVLIGNGLDSTQGMFVGQAHLFDTAGNLIQTFDDPTVTTQDYFGLSVAIDADHLLIGAPRDDTVNADVGQAHLYVLSILGDINRDGVVDVGDLALVGNQWGTDGSGHPLAWKADIAPVPNGDGVVDIGDMAIVGFNWTSSGGPSLAGAAAVPTPAALPVGILCLLGLSRRRH